MNGGFDRPGIVKALRRLGELALESGVHIEINIYGGSAMILTYNVGRRTRDVDAVFHPREEVMVMARKVAQEQSLPESWLSDDVRLYTAPVEQKRGLLLELEGLRVQVPTAHYLLAMKVRASREPMPGYEGDRADLLFLVRKMEINSLEQLQESVDRFFPDEVIPPSKEAFLQEIINEVWRDE